MKKRVIAVLLTAFMVFGLMACGKEGKEASNPGTSDTSAPEQKTETKTESKPETKATEAVKQEEEELTCNLTVWSPSEDQAESEGQWLQTMCDQFTKLHPNWHITFTYGTCQEGEAKKNVTQDVDGAADVYIYANDNITDLLTNKALSRIGGAALEQLKALNTESILNTVTVDGGVYGFPFTTNTWFMYYDKSVFSEEDIKSLDAMLTKGVVSFPLTNSWYNASFYIANGCTMFGDDQMTEEAGIDFSGEKAVQVTNYLVDLVKNKNFQNDSGGSGLTGLKDGTVNAFFSGAWSAADAKKALGENFGVAALPCVTINGAQCQLKSFAGTKAIGVNPTCEYQQVAIALALYLSSADAQLSHYQLRNVVPCNTELLARDSILADAVVMAQNATYESTSILQPFVSKMGDYWTPSDNFSKALVSGEITHENAEAKTEEYNIAVNTDVAAAAEKK